MSHHIAFAPEFDYEGYAAYELTLASYHEALLATVLHEHQLAEAKRERTRKREAEAKAMLASLKNLNIGYAATQSRRQRAPSACPSLSSSTTSSAASSPAHSPADMPAELLEWAGAGGRVRLAKS